MSQAHQRQSNFLTAKRSASRESVPQKLKPKQLSQSVDLSASSSFASGLQSRRNQSRHAQKKQSYKKQLTRSLGANRFEVREKVFARYAEYCEQMQSGSSAGAAPTIVSEPEKLFDKPPSKEEKQRIVAEQRARRMQKAAE